MLPTISAGSRVRVVSRSRRPRIAEIWAFCGPTGVIVVHRYRRRDPAGRFVFRGDNIVQHDVPVDAERLIGVVTQVEAGGTARSVGLAARIRWLVSRLAARIRR